MNQKQLEIFIVLADTLNFTKTAEVLFLSQTTVTLQIKNLEEEMQAKLFDRTSRSVKLTYAGEVFLEGATEILKKMRKTAEQTASAARGYTGRIKIGFADAVNATGMSKTLRQYAGAFPQIRLFVEGGYPADLIDGLLSDKYDLVYIPSFQDLRSDALERYTIESFRTIAAFHKDHRFHRKRALRYSDFSEEDFIQISGIKQELDFSSEFMHQLQQHDVSVHLAARLDNIDSVFMMLDAGLGITVLPEYFIGRFSGTSEIRTCPIKEDLKPTDFQVVWKKGKRSAELNQFLRYNGYLKSR